MTLVTSATDSTAQQLHSESVSGLGAAAALLLALLLAQPSPMCSTQLSEHATHRLLTALVRVMKTKPVSCCSTVRRSGKKV